MRSPSKMDAPSEMFFFLFDMIPGCLLNLSAQAYKFDWLIFTYFNATKNLNLTTRTRTTKNLKQF